MRFAVPGAFGTASLRARGVDGGYMCCRLCLSSLCILFVTCLLRGEDAVE